MRMIERVLMLRENAGSGVESDPFRWVRVFVYENSLEEICRIDEWEIEELRRLRYKAPAPESHKESNDE